jgi:SAM-dependent methyltransferase
MGRVQIPPPIPLRKAASAESVSHDVGLTAVDENQSLDALPTPPQDLAGGIGAGDFWQIGMEIAGLAMATARLSPADRVLDVGCGLGRVALPLSRFIGRIGSYDGFDTSSEYIEWCRSALALDPERFRFHHFSIQSSHYNESGSISAETFTFPWPENSFTLAMAASLFTHLSAPATTKYLHEIARTLQPKGRLFASFFVLDEQSTPLAESGTTDPRLTHRTKQGMIGDPENADAAVAFDAQWLASTLESAGFVFDAFYPGRWRHLPVVSHQDIVIAHKP